MRRTAWILIGFGVLLLVLAALLRFVVAPAATKLPSDTDTTTTYSGKGSVLNVAALQSGDVANALARDIPVTLDRHVYVSDSDGDTAIVHDDGTLKAGSASSQNNHTYAVDRTTMTETAPINGVQVEQHQGLTVTMPVDPQPTTDIYTYWDSVTRQAVPVTYIGTEDRAGRETYHYRATASGALADSALQQQLPASLPRTLAPRLLALLPTQTQQQLAPLVAALPPQVPLAYTATSTYDVWADAKLGAPLDTKINRSVVANVILGNTVLPLLPVLAVDVTEDQASVADAASRADDAALKLDWIELWGPIVLLVLGLALIVVGLLVGRRPPEPPVDAPTARVDAGSPAAT
ncbi:porin PorA family protein [Kribbella sp. NPDC003557]|uniref:porin PorA family protein n=1 Tax=Kribbella sp. NPDC003557 TaxID=3154449 RepID=UPI0033A26BCF